VSGSVPINAFKPNVVGSSLKLAGSIITILIVSQLNPQLHAEDSGSNQWTQRKEKDGITIYARPVTGSKYQEFKGVVELDATQASALALLDDVSVCAQWLNRCESSVVLDQLDDQQRYVYQISALPFPAAGRDAIFHATVIQQDADNIRVELESQPDYIKETKYVRIRVAEGHYLLTKLAENKIRLTWEQHIDPAGALPAFMVNSLLTDLPFKSLAKFRELVLTDKYRDAIFVFDDNGARTGLIY
jgi:hypothetical protein